MIRIAHIITGLNTGGAEMMLHKLVSAHDRTKFDPVVISLMDYGTTGRSIEELGITFYAMGMTRGFPTPALIWRLYMTIRKIKPDVVQGWMYHGNLAALLTTFFYQR